MRSAIARAREPSVKNCGKAAGCLQPLESSHCSENQMRKISGESRPLEFARSAAAIAAYSSEAAARDSFRSCAASIGFVEPSRATASARTIADTRGP